MSFSADVRAELAGLIPSARHCRIASLAAILSCIGKFETAQDKNGQLQVALSLNSDNQEALRKCFTLLQKTVNIKTVLPKKGPEKRETRSAVRIDALPGKLLELAKMLNLIKEDGSFCDPAEGVSPLLLQRACCRRCYVRDMFLCCGSMSDPGREYHMEFDCASEAQAAQLQEILLGFDNDAKVIPRKKLFIVYLKDSTDIVDVLNLMGASVSMMAMENQRILKDLRNSVNRRVNCETANIGKTVQASRRQIGDIRYLEQQGILRTLPESLRSMAELRLEYPDVPLRELGKLATPEIGKSGVNHRLRRLSELADRYRAQHGG